MSNRYIHFKASGVNIKYINFTGVSWNTDDI